MFCEPSLVAGDDAADPEGEAFLAEQRVSAVAAAEGADLVVSGNVGHQHLLRVTRPVVLGRGWRMR